LRILHVFKTYYPDTIGGVEQVIAQLGGGLNKLGHENRIYTVSPDPHPAMLRRPEGVVYRSQRTVEIASVPLSIRAAWEFRRHARWADVVHYHYPWPFGDVLHFLWARNKPSVVTYHSDIVKQKWGLKLYVPVRELFLRAVDAVIATSPGYRQSSEILALLPRDVGVIPLGIDEAGYPKPAPEALRRWRERLGENFFLFVGVLRYYKGLHTLVEAARGFSGRVVIAGEGPEREELEKEATARGLRNVEFLGHISDEDKVCLLQLCRAFVFPSHVRTEAFGMSLVEASMCAKPMITCEIATGTSYVNEAGVTGHVVPPEDVLRLRGAMQDLSDRAEAARQMGLAARARFERLFTADAMAERYDALYRKITSPGP
jgi:glycosyltransferase involved in cell wall biosynthesis